MAETNAPQHLQQFPSYVGLQSQYSQDVQVEQELQAASKLSEDGDVSPFLTSLADDGEPRKQPHTYLYVGSVILVLGFIFLYIFCCKWTKDNKGKKKPIKNQLVEQKMQTDDTGKGTKVPNPHQIQLGELP